MTERSSRDKSFLEVRNGGCLTLGIGKKYRIELTPEITGGSTSLEMAQIGLLTLGELDRKERAAEREECHTKANAAIARLQAELKKQGCPDDLGFANKVHGAYQSQVHEMQSFFR